MECLLLLLAFRLVSSDKLDLTYLPPPGANFAGGNPEELNTPLEYLKTGTAQNGQPVTDINKGNAFDNVPADLDLDMSKTIDYSNPQNVNEFSQRNQFTSNEYGFDRTTLRPSNLYGNFPLNQPTNGYLPNNEKTSDYYYYVPAMPFYENNIGNQVRGNFEPNNNINFGQYPNQINKDITINNQFIPKTATSNDVLRNYEPNTFGYYGGNPMIMSTNSLPQDFGNVAITPKFGEYEKNPPKATNQDKPNTNTRTTAKPFQTPLVRSDIRKGYSNAKNPQFPTTTISPRRNNSPIEVNQRSNIPSPELKSARPLAESDRNALILSYENVLYPERFSYSFDTSNGIHADESGTATDGVRAVGSYSFTGDDGKVYTVSYTADENGFQPKGDHLPTPPPVPEAIKKVIEQANRNKAVGIIDDGSYDEKKYGYMNYQGAMDRYRPFNYNNLANVNRRFGNTKSKSNNTPGKLNKNLGKLPTISEKPANNRELINGGLTIPEESSRFDTGGNKNKAQEIHTQGQINSVNRLQTADYKNNPEVNTRSGTNRTSSEITTKENNQNEQPNLDQSYIPKTQINGYDQFEKGDRQKPNSQTQNLANYISDNKNVESFSKNIQDEIYKKVDTPTGVLFNENGYYYVPPFIKFNPVSKELVNKKETFVTNYVPTQQIVATTITKRIDIENDQNKEMFDDRVILTEIPNQNATAITNSNRKPYIDDSGNGKELYYDGTNGNSPIDGFENQGNQDESVISYTPSTTPMPSQTTQNEYQQTNGYYYPNPYYEFTNNPAAVFETLPNAVENRVNFPTGIPKITVSQDFVTTTFKPSLLSDGVLEVNQNVQIYGLGTSEPTVSFGKFAEKDKNNNELYTTAIPSNEGFKFGSYPQQVFRRPDQDTTIFQGNTNQIYGNKFLTNGSRLFDTVIPMNEPTIPQDVTTPIRVLTKSRNPTIAPIGEDFSGPKQTQRFDPVTGYYYK